MLNRLDRYLLRELTVTFVAVTGVLLIVLLSNQFARVLGQAAASGFPASIVLTLIGLTTLQQLTVLVPIGLFLGIVLALGRLYHESEMTAMTACGVGPLRIYRPIVLLAVVVAALLAVLSGVFIVLLELIGGLLSMVAFMAASLWILNRSRPLQNALIAVLLPVAIYVVFEVWLRASMPRGLLPLPF